MGTHADFYVGRGKDAEWLGSVSNDGYPDGLLDLFIHGSGTEEAWRQCVSDEIGGRTDATRPEEGWPWPWDDSGTTDYAYAFDGGKVWGSNFGHRWFAIDLNDRDLGEPDVVLGSVAFPDMGRTS